VGCITRESGAARGADSNGKPKVQRQAGGCLKLLSLEEAYRLGVIGEWPIGIF